MKWDVQRDYYADLGLKAGATPSKIKTQYRKLGGSPTYQLMVYAVG